MSKIAKVEPIPVSYPEPNDFNALRHLCLVKITTDDGVVGWGESITQFPEANFATKAIIEGMAERVVGKDPLENVAIWHSLRDKKWWYGYGGGIASYAVAAIDMALWDIKGKLLNTSVLNLLGGAVHEKLPVDRVLPRPLRGHRRDGRGGPGMGRARPPRRQGRLWQARQRAPGLRARPGRGVHAPDARGPGPEGVAHDRLRLERQVGRHDRGASRPGVRGVRPDWIEEPLGAWDPEGYANLRSKTTTLIAYGEKEWDLDGFERVLATGTVDVVGIDPGPRRGHHGLQAGRPSGSSTTGARRTRTPGRAPSAPRPAWPSASAPRRSSCSSSSRCATRCSTSW